MNECSGLATPFTDNAIHILSGRGAYVINAAIERLQSRNCESIATRFGIDTERMGDFNEQSGRKTGSSKIAVIQISQFLSTSIMHIGNIVI